MDAAEINKELKSVPIKIFLERATNLTQKFMISELKLTPLTSAKKKTQLVNYEVTKDLFEHFKQLLNGKSEETVSKFVHVSPKHPKEIDVNFLIKRLSNDRQNACFKEIVETNQYKIKKCLEKMWSGEAMPKEWKVSFLVGRYKLAAVGNDLNNFLPYCHLNILYKIWAKFLQKLLSYEMKKKSITSPGQAYEKNDVLLCDIIFVLNHIIQMTLASKENLFVFFINLKDAYSSVNREKMFEKLNDNISKYLSSRIKEIYEETIYTNGDMKFWAQRGLKVGCPLTNDLFQLYTSDLEMWLKDGFRYSIKVGNTKLPSLIYNDNIAIFAKSDKDLQYLMDRFNDYITKWDFHINPDKSKVVIFGNKKNPANLTWKCGDEIIKTVSSFCFVRYIFDSDGLIEECSRVLESEMGVRAEKALAGTYLAEAWKDIQENKLKDKPK